MNTTYVLTAYAIYLPVAIVLTLYISKTFFKLSIVFMREIFSNQSEMANATNKLYELGFYLLNMGFALYLLQIDQILPDYKEMVEMLSAKIGGFSIYLCAMLLFNLLLFFKQQKKVHVKESSVELD